MSDAESTLQGLVVAGRSPTRRPLTHSSGVCTSGKLVPRIDLGQSSIGADRGSPFGRWDAAFRSSPPGAVRLRVTASSHTRGTVGIGYAYAYRYLGLSIRQHHPVDIAVPGVPDVRRWQLTFDLTELTGRLTVCASRDNRGAA